MSAYQINRHLVRAAAAVLVLLPAVAVALNFNFLQQAPVAFATDEDRHIFGRHLRKALESGITGEETRWENPATGARGSITLIESGTLDGMPCAVTRLRSEIKGRSGEHLYTVCATPDGGFRWGPP